jgi:hypothetical protein
LQNPGFEPARAARQPIAGAIANESEIVGLDILPVRQRRFVDIENERRLADLAAATLDKGTRRGKNGGDIAIVIFGLIGEQHLFDFVDIQWRRGRLRNAHLRRDGAIGRAGANRRAGKSNGAERDRDRALEPCCEALPILLLQPRGDPNGEHCQPPRRRVT